MKSAGWSKQLLENQKQEIQKRTAFGMLLIVMAVYYAYRLFALTPWYDELYTYYWFISKGPVYAAIHWPLPNNHVGYSVLSACLAYLGNAYIGLRGISYLCALANMCLLYKIMERYKKGWIPFITVLLYISMNLVNQLAVQGRGYTLGITCYLIAWFCMIRICEEEKTAKKFYFIYIAALVLGLYTVSSDVYWVIPLCFSGGFYLLVKGKQEYGKLIKLILASVVAALGTIFLYATIWLAIGSNLLTKDEAGSYYGMDHIKVILNAPLAAISRGMKYMLDTPYIQSEERAGFAGRLLDFIATLSGYYFRSVPVLVIWGIGILVLVCGIVSGIRRKEYAELLLYLSLFTGIVMVPVCLLIQCKRPYYRVFTYGGVLLAVLIGVLLEKAAGIVPKMDDMRKRKIISTLMLIAVIAFSVKCIGFSGYNEQYGDREHAISEAFAQTDMGRWNTFCVTDCNQEYLLYFLYGIRCESKKIEGADVVLLDKRMTDPDFHEMVWEFYHYYDTIPWAYMEQNMTPVYENENYILYERKEEIKVSRMENCLDENTLEWRKNEK